MWTAATALPRLWRNAELSMTDCVEGAGTRPARLMPNSFYTQHLAFAIRHSPLCLRPRQGRRERLPRAVITAFQYSIPYAFRNVKCTAILFFRPPEEDGTTDER